jgi:hypothetical protein
LKEANHVYGVIKKSLSMDQADEMGKNVQDLLSKQTELAV